MKRILYIITGVYLCIGLVSCTSSEQEVHNHAGDDDHSHSHASEYPNTTFTGWTEKTEIFVEYPVLAVGKSSRFAAHFSSMETFKPLLSGRSWVELRKDGKVVLASETVNAPSSPGIFRPVINPTTSGIFDLVFYIKNETISDTLTVKGAKVYNSEHDALHITPSDERDGVVFTKEQAWKIDFAVAPVENKDVKNIIRTSGEVLPINSDQESISASTSGIVIFKKNNLIEGQDIRKGSPLFVVNNDKIISSNLAEKYAVTEANLQQSQKNLERSEELLEKGIISQKEYDERNRKYQVNLASYQTLTNNYSSGGMTLEAPTSGILTNLHVTNGQYVEEGQAIATISRNKTLLVEAEVSQKYFKDIPKIVTANIQLPWNDHATSIKEYNGTLVPTIRTAKSHYIPVLFKIDNKGDIIPGTYLDVYLQISDSRQELVVPKTALLREYDMYYVYVMVEGESFEKRNVTIGSDDGNYVQVLDGLTESEMVVTSGAYAIKMASMSSSIPAHGHEH